MGDKKLRDALVGVGLLCVYIAILVACTFLGTHSSVTQPTNYVASSNFLFFSK